VVPPPPWRKIAIGAVVALAVLGVAAALIVPEIDEGKDERAKEEQRNDAAYEAAKQQELAREGKLHHGQGESPPPDASSADERQARRVLVHDLEGAITRDARARVRRGNLDGPILETECKVNPPSRRPLERDLSVRRLDYDCVAIKSHSPTGQFVVGHSFDAIVDLEHFRFTWAMSCLIPGEGSARPKC